MKIFKCLQVSIDFSTKFLIISLALGALPPEPPPNAYFQNFLNFRVNFHKILKNFQKIAKFPSKFVISYKFFIDF